MNFLPDSDLFYIIAIRKGSFGCGTFGLGWKWHQPTVSPSFNLSIRLNFCLFSLQLLWLPWLTVRNAYEKKEQKFFIVNFEPKSIRAWLSLLVPLQIFIPWQIFTHWKDDLSIILWKEWNGNQNCHWILLTYFLFAPSW